ncbi:MAG: ATP-binding cassette domain-containing protein [Phenylobacterium sp.]|nr:MAG: ATP-binding cassette domain-containing protein [Phenylobacterium sp.]
MPPLYVRQLSYGYPSQEIFRDLSWETDAQVAVLEGPSGCGKTTLLRLLAGHLGKPESFESNFPRRIRLVLQDDGLFPWLTTLGNLELSPAWPGFDRVGRAIQPIADAVSGYASQIAGTLSFGQRRLVELLRVLACPTPVILLDEPLNFLDSARRCLIVAAINDLASDGTRFAISSHYESDFGHLSGSVRYKFVGDMPYRDLTRVGPV